MTWGRGRQREWSGGDEVLTRYGRETSAVFELLGRDEVDLTSALGWTLSRSPLLLAALWARLGLPPTLGRSSWRWRSPMPKDVPTWNCCRLR